MNEHFSFIILTYNEEQHLPRLLSSIGILAAPVFILDSGSTDGTMKIAKAFGATVGYHPFRNHPEQWDIALNMFDIRTPWVIGLDADHIVTKRLQQRLKDFRDADHLHLNGIYFNRRNYFKGKWIRFGGYYPFYLLKMIRYQVGYSDLSERMDHRFVVPGQTAIWRDGIILEENLKENEIAFWIQKHDRYSSLLAEQEIASGWASAEKPTLFGSPNQRKAWSKRLWSRLPLYVRPFLYFTYRYIFKLGFLDGRTGTIFHFLQAFWFRLIVDIKIEELKKTKMTKTKTDLAINDNQTPLRTGRSFF